MTQTPTDTEASDLRALARAVLDGTEEARDLTQAIKQTADTLLRRLDEPVVPGLQGSIDEILQVVRAEKTRPSLDIRKCAGVALGLVVLSGSCGWYLGAPPRALAQRGRLMDQVHAILVERQSGLSTEVKTKLAAVYRQQGFAPLEQQGGKP